MMSAIEATTIKNLCSLSILINEQKMYSVWSIGRRPTELSGSVCLVGISTSIRHLDCRVNVEAKCHFLNFYLV